MNPLIGNGFAHKPPPLTSGSELAKFTRVAVDPLPVVFNAPVRLPAWLHLIRPPRMVYVKFMSWITKTAAPEGSSPVSTIGQSTGAGNAMEAVFEQDPPVALVKLPICVAGGVTVDDVSNVPANVKLQANAIDPPPNVRF